MLRLLLGLGLLAAAQLLAPPLAANDLELQQVVLLSRHGVRSPTETKPPLSEIAADPWPAWPVPPGYLTTRGAQLATEMGKYYRAEFAARGLIPSGGCPQTHEVYAWSDLEQRTKLTAQAILDGMYPGCGLKPEFRVRGKLDPLFHPLGAGICRIDDKRAKSAILGRIGGDFSAILAAYRQPLSAMQSAPGCCSATLCQADDKAPSCGLAQLPTAISKPANGKAPKLKGPLAIASTAAEVFLLQYAEGMPAEQVAWGRVATPERMSELFRLHTLQFDLMERTPYIAARQGSNLAHQILAAFDETVSGKTDATAKAPRGSKFVLFVGHDDNIANLGGMLRLDWALDSYQPNQTPPAGAIGFELLRDKQSGKFFVRAFYESQTLEQMRTMATLDLAHPPAHATIAIPACAEAHDGVTCPWSGFKRLVTAALARQCVGDEK